MGVCPGGDVYSGDRVATPGALRSRGEGLGVVAFELVEAEFDSVDTL